MDIEINDSIKSLILQIDDIKEKLSNFEGNYSALLSEDILSKFNSLNSAISDLSANYNSLKSTAENISTLLEGTNLEQMQQEISTLQSDISGINDTISSNKTSAEESITTLQNNISTLQQTATSMNSDILEIQSQLSDLANNLPTVDLTDIENNISNISSQITTINDSVQGLFNSIESTNQQVDSVNKTANSNKTKLQELSDSLTIALSNISGLDTKIKDLENLCNETTLTVSSYSRTINELKVLINKLNSALEQITTNKNDISTLKTQIAEITTSISEINELISQLQTSISELESKTTSNTESIGTLTTQVSQIKTSNETNTANISVLSGTLAGIEDRVAVLETKLNGLLQNIDDNPCSESGCMCNFKFNNIEDEIEEIRDILARLYPDVDPNKKDEIDFDEPSLSDNTFTTEDTIEFLDIKSRQINERPFIAVCATSNATTTAKITLDFDITFTRIYADAKITVYHNGETIATLATPQDQLGTALHYNFVIENATLTDKNVFSFITQLTAGYNAYINSFKMKIEAPNIRILNKPRPIHIDYFDGKYYISDCSSGKVKCTCIEKDKLIRTGNIKLEQIDLDAKFYQTMIACLYDTDGNITGHKEVHMYGCPDLKTVYLISDTDSPALSSSNSIYSVFAQGKKRKGAEILVYTEYFRGKSGLSTFSYDNEYAYFFHKSATLSNHYSNFATVPNSVATVNSVKYLANYWDYENTGWTALLTQANGDIYLFSDLSTYNTAIRLKVGNGTNAKGYVVDPVNRVYDIFYNNFSKTIRVRVKYVKSPGTEKYEIVEKKEIGSYQDYFRGANNDYFVIKDGKILYYKDKQGANAGVSGNVNQELA